MNTKTMRLPPRRVLTPTTPTPTPSPINNSKRKERDEGALHRPNPKPSPSSLAPTTINPAKSLKPDKPRAVFEPPRGGVKGLEPTSSNQLLAGFLAHEFLTKGTLFGEPWDPSRAGECVTPSEADKRKGEATRSRSRTSEAEPERYGELAELLRASGTHVAGIVNPTQLSRFLHL